MPAKRSQNAVCNKLVVIVGPTASGKTSLVIKLAKKYHGEIICADSRTIYRGLDVGTAKPNLTDQIKVKHHLLDIITPDQVFSAAEFKKIALKTISNVQKKSKIPFLVGGSGMYIDSVLFDYKFRRKTGVDISEMSESEIIELAKKLYPKQSAQISDKNIRRLEQLLSLGPANKDDRKKLKIACKIVGLLPNKPLLKQKIAKRTICFLSNGIVQETQKIRKNYGKDNILLRTIGYKQVNDYLEGDLSKKDLEIAINSATYQLARRQLTWFKRNPYVHWVQSLDEAEMVIDDYLKNDKIR